MLQVCGSVEELVREDSIVADFSKLLKNVVVFKNAVIIQNLLCKQNVELCIQ